MKYIAPMHAWKSRGPLWNLLTAESKDLEILAVEEREREIKIFDCVKWISKMS